MDRNDWTGTLAGVDRAQVTESLVTVLRFGESGTAAFWGMAASGRAYVIKVLGNPQGDQCLATERIVSAAGNLIGAPVRPVALIDIASTFQRVQYAEGRFIPQGVAHGAAGGRGRRQPRAPLGEGRQRFARARDHGVVGLVSR